MTTLEVGNGDGGAEEKDLETVEVGDDSSGDAGVEQPKKEESKYESKAEDKKKCNKWCILGGYVAALTVLVLVIVLPLTLGTKKQDQIIDHEGLDGSTRPQPVTLKVKSSPFNSTLSFFNEDILSGYQTPEELSLDVEQASWAVLNQVVDSNTGGDGQGMMMGRDGSMSMPVTTEADFANDAADESGATSSSAGGAAKVGSDVNDFGTNNQEDEVEEGDVIVSDGSFVYAAYGDYLVVWNPRTGVMVQQLAMPEIEYNQTWHQHRGGGWRRRKTLSVAEDSPYWWHPKPSIRSLVLSNNRLLITVDGYSPMMLQHADLSEPVITDYLATQLRLYDTSDLGGGGSLTFLSSTHVHGTFNEVRVVNGIAHVMTMANINTYPWLIQHAERWNMEHARGGEKMSDEDYIAEVRRLAEENVPKFSAQLVSELQAYHDTLPKLVKINTWHKEASDANLDALVSYDGNIETLAQVHSIDLNGVVAGGNMTVSSAGTFLPGYWGRFYGNTDTLIIAGQGWDYNPKTMKSSDTTYFVAFGINGASAVPHSVGSVDGYLLNNHAIDVVRDATYGDVLRVATSISNGWIIMPVIMEEPMEDAADMDMDETEDAATTSFIAEPQVETENYVIILQMPGLDGNETGVMTELGREKLGLPRELFTAVRFFDNVAYAVTFERTDPFYVLDLSNPTDPVVKAALKITGFSSYLHSMNDDNTMLLAIGQEADDEGVTLGVQLTVFDVTNPSDPKVVKRHVIEQEKDMWSYTDMEHDFKAGRYVREIQRLIIPLNVYAETEADSFHGFVTFVVNETSIQEDCGVAHGHEYYVESRRPCYYCAYFPPRSMIFDGKLMTVKDHFVKSTDMNNCSNEWSFEVVIKDDDPNAGCCGMWF